MATDRVEAAERLAARFGFENSSREGTGRLLAALAAASTGPVAESGTGCGYGTAWLRAGLRVGERLVTVERDEVRANAVRELFADDPAVVVLHDDWTALRPYAPFGLFFVDGGGKRDGPDAVADLVAPGGIVVMDDFTPSASQGRDERDDLRIAWFGDPRFVTAEVRTEADHAVLVCTRRSDLEVPPPPVEDRVEPGDPV